MSKTLIRGENGLVSYESGSIRDTIHQTISDTLRKKGIDAAVICPEGIDPNEWIAVHVIDFYNDVIMLFSVIQYECTSYSCPSMTAGNYEFMWTDHDLYKKATRLCAHTYIEYLMNWIIHLIENETIFPIQQDIPFPDNYMDTVRNILKRLLRVYAHIYCQHFQSLHSYELNDQFEFSVTHFIYFVDQFKLVSPYDMRPLADLAMEKAPNLSITTEMVALLKQHEGMRLGSPSNLSSVSSSTKMPLPSPRMLFGIASDSTEITNMYSDPSPNGNSKSSTGSRNVRVFL